MAEYRIRDEEEVAAKAAAKAGQDNTKP